MSGTQPLILCKSSTDMGQKYNSNKNNMTTNRNSKDNHSNSNVNNKKANVSGNSTSNSNICFRGRSKNKNT